MLDQVQFLTCHVAYLSSQIVTFHFFHSYDQAARPQSLAYCCLPLSIKHECCKVNIWFMVFYCQALNGNQLVQLKYFPTLEPS
jgi:hypothetical protein